MSKLLHVEASPRKARAYSITVAQALLSEYKSLHPDAQIGTWDLWGEALPEMNNAAIEATYLAKRGEPMSEEQTAAWRNLDWVFDRFAVADKLVISTPMWNFGIPYKLKQFIDLITLADKAFRVTPEGAYEGLLTNRKVVVIYASGGDYSAGSPAEAMDHQKPYLRTWMNFVGLTDYRELVVAPTIVGPEESQKLKEQAFLEARDLASWL